MDGTQICILKQANQISLCSLLQGKDSRSLESEVSLKILGNLANEALEWEFANEELCALLIASDFTKSHSSGAISVGLLDTTSSRGTLSGSFGRQLFSWGLATSALACSLLGTSHPFVSVLSRDLQCYDTRKVRFSQISDIHIYIVG